MGIRRSLKWLLALAAYHSGLVWLVRRLRSRRAIILTYHRVRERWVGDGITVSRAVFERQIRYLTRTYHVVSLDELAAMLKGTRPLVPGAAAVTFDDGFRDNYILARPILRRYGCPATVFVTVGAVDGSTPLWTEQIRLAVWGTRAGSLDATWLGLGPLPMGSDAERLQSIRSLKRRLKRMPDTERQQALAELLRRLLPAAEAETAAEAHDEMLTWEMVGAMPGDGIAIGAHTVTHRILTRIERRDAKWEIEESKQRIEKALGQTIHHFAYPNGGREDWNAGIQALVREAGFATASTTIPGTNAVGQDPFALRRVEINDPGCLDPLGRFSTAMFAVQLSGLWPW
jgi:peptidoglycan/xylan/chitin deacetylase (PgdA/CDA1 family)